MLKIKGNVVAEIVFKAALALLAIWACTSFSKAKGCDQLTIAPQFQQAAAVQCQQVALQQVATVQCAQIVQPAVAFTQLLVPQVQYQTVAVQQFQPQFVQSVSTVGCNGVGFNGIGFNSFGFNRFGFNGIGFNRFGFNAGVGAQPLIVNRPLLDFRIRLLNRRLQAAAIRGNFRRF